MENVITSTKTMMGELGEHGCDCANFDVGGGELEGRRNRKGIGGSYISVSWKVPVPVPVLSFTQ